MPNYNRVILAGHTTRDPESRAMPGGGTVCKFGLAVNHKWKDKAGESKQEVCFIDCVSFGKTAELIAKYVVKGRAILVEGRLKLEQWEDKNGGGKRSKHVVNVDNCQFLSFGDSDDDKPPAKRGGTHDGSGYETQPHSAPPPDGAPTGDDIPF